MRSQNLLDSEWSKRNYLFHRRGWVGKYTSRFQWNWEVCVKRGIGGDWFKCKVSLGGEDSKQVQFSFGLLGISLYLTFHNILPKRWEIGWYTRGEVKNPYWSEESHGRDYGFYLSNNHLVLSWHSSNSSWGSSRNYKQYGWSKSCFIDEVILGKRLYTDGLPSVSNNVPILFPEGRYHLNISIATDVWKYKRWPWWPFTKRLSRAKVDVVEKSGLPVPGKGESSWDCGDDAIYSSTFPCNSVWQATEEIRKSVYNTRSKYGGGPRMYFKKMMRGEWPPPPVESDLNASVGQISKGDPDGIPADRLQ